MTPNLKYLFYHARWQLSGLILLPVIYLGPSLNLPTSLNVVIANLIGAIVFWNIDKILTK